MKRNFKSASTDFDAYPHQLIAYQPLLDPKAFVLKLLNCNDMHHFLYEFTRFSGSGERKVLPDRHTSRKSAFKISSEPLPVSFSFHTVNSLN